jgi:hypothetical protein
MANAALSIRGCTKNVDLSVTMLENSLETFEMVADVVLYFTLTCLKEKIHVCYKILRISKVYTENNHKT